jgi:hypothetical protein
MERTHRLLTTCDRSVRLGRTRAGPRVPRGARLLPGDPCHPNRLPGSQLRRALSAQCSCPGWQDRPDRNRRPAIRHGIGPATQGLRARPRLPAPPVSSRPAAPAFEASRQAGRGSLHEHLLVGSARHGGGRTDTREEGVRQRGAFRAVWDRQLQPDQRPTDGPASVEPVRRVAWPLQQLLVGLHGGGNRDRLRNQHHGQPAAGLDQFEVHPDVGMEPERDARWHQHGVLPPQSPRARRAHRVHRPAHDAERRVRTRP